MSHLEPNPDTDEKGQLDLLAGLSTFSLLTLKDQDSIFTSLRLKDSSGIDEISNKLLKHPSYAGTKFYNLLPAHLCYQTKLLQNET